MESDREHRVASLAAGSSPAESISRWQLPHGQGARGFVLYTVCIALLFVKPLARLLLYTAQSEFHSYVVIVPLIVGYLLVRERRSQPRVYTAAPGWAAVFFAASLLALVANGTWREALSLNDELALLALAFVGLVIAGGFLFLGSAWMAARAFPMSFLIFLIPMPDGVRAWIETGSLLGSARVAEWLLDLTGTPFLREGERFSLPGIELHVARECSGIHSSWVLFMTSLVAAHRMLDSHWRRFVLVAFVIPLALVRNGLRITVIALLCVHIGPEMIDSPIHRQGGPLFFVLSLGPLFLLLHLLRRRKNSSRTAGAPEAQIEIG